MKDPNKLRDLIVEKVELADVMVGYGVHFQFDPRGASEVQFKCPFHGKDTKPSARLYNQTKSCFCWVCRKSWDVVSFTMEKENLFFKQALLYLINRYRVDTSSIPDVPTLDLKEETVKSEDKKVLFKRIHNNLLDLRKKIPFEKFRALCSVYFMSKYQDSQKVDVLGNLKKIEDKIICLTHQ